MTEEQAPPFEHGPYVQVAAFCERVMEERDGVMSLIRLVDVITHTEQGPEAPAEMPAFRYSLNLVVNLKSGTARGRHDVTITPEMPSGESLSTLSVSVQLSGEGRGANIVSPINLEYTMEGLYWFNIGFDGIRLTRIPLEVRYTRVGTASTARPTQQS